MQPRRKSLLFLLNKVTLLCMPYRQENLSQSYLRLCVTARVIFKPWKLLRNATGLAEQPEALLLISKVLQLKVMASEVSFQIGIIL